MAECVLGCGDEYRVVFTNRCGSKSLCTMEKEISALDYNRLMDETSEANVTINIPGGDGENAGCCDCIGNLRAWIHSVAIYRSGDLVWGPGPLMNNVLGGE